MPQGFAHAGARVDYLAGNGMAFCAPTPANRQPLGEAHVGNDGDAIAIELAPELRRLAFEPGASRRLILPSRRRRGRAGALTAQQRGR
jgi:hypothetical protein